LSRIIQPPAVQCIGSTGRVQERPGLQSYADPTLNSDPKLRP